VLAVPGCHGSLGVIIASHQTVMTPLTFGQRASLETRSRQVKLLVNQSQVYVKYQGTSLNSKSSRNSCEQTTWVRLESTSMAVRDIAIALILLSLDARVKALDG